jgi:predicted ribosome quality control (RQC) complex YloA/Tae2 family protein
MESFRKTITSSGKHILAGRSAENNEELISQVRGEEMVLHTKQPGSPFCNIKAPYNEINKTDLKEAAIFCARYSQNWRDNKSNVVVQYFIGNDIFKQKTMKLGTFGVKNAKEIVIKKGEILKFIDKNETTNRN